MSTFINILFISVSITLVHSKTNELVVIKSTKYADIQSNQLNLYYSLEYQSPNYHQLQSQANQYCEQLDKQLTARNVDQQHFKVILSSMTINKLQSNKDKLRYQVYLIIQLQIDLSSGQYHQMQQTVDQYLQKNGLAFQYGTMCVVGSYAKQQEKLVIGHIILDNRQQAEYAASVMDKKIVGVQKFKVKVANRCVKIPVVTKYAKQVRFRIKAKGKYYIR